jgi:microcystin-dependent protein
MAQPYIGEIRMFAGNFAPAGWMMCDGQLLPISEYDTLFVVLGTTYGGDGQSTFALPDLRGRVPLHNGQGSGLSNYQISETGGVESVTLTTQQIPNHTHPARCDNGGGNATSNPAGGVWSPSDANQYYTGAPTGFMAPAGSPINSTIAGGSQPHDNQIPYLCINYIISLFGLFPSPT